MPPRITTRRVLATIGAVTALLALGLLLFGNEGDEPLGGSGERISASGEPGSEGQPPGVPEHDDGEPGADESEQISATETEGEEEEGGDYESPAEELARAGEESRVIFERQKAFTEPRAFPRDQIPGGAYLRAQRQAAAAPTLSGANAFAPAPAAGGAEVPESPGTAAALGGGFSFAGPSRIGEPGSESAPFTGRITAIATHPSNADTALVGAATGGVWKTTDGGASWTPIFEDQASLSIGAIAINPANPSIIWVGTGEANRSTDSYYGAGLFRSTNGGATWSKIAAVKADGCHISDIEVGPVDANRILVGVIDQNHAGDTAGCQQGLYRSTDGGATWSNRGLVPTSIAAVPGTANIVYAGSYGAGLYKSTDGGVSFFKRSDPKIPTTGFGRVEVATSATNQSRVYAAFAVPTGGLRADTGTGGYYSGILRTDDAAESWKIVSVPSQPFAWYSLDLAVDPSNSLKAAFGGVRPYLIDNVAVTELSPGTTHADLHAVVYDAAGRLWLGTDGGVYRASGTTVTNLNNPSLSITQFNAGFAGDPEGVLLGGTQDNGTITSPSRTSTFWTNVIGCDGGYAAVDPVDPSNLYMTTQYTCGGHLVRRSGNGGQVSIPADSGLNLNETALFYPPMVMDPSDSSRLYLGLDNVYTTADRAASWTKLGTQSFAGRISAVVASRSDSSVYVGTESGVVGRWRTGSWTNVTGSLPTRFVSDLWVDSGDPAHVLVGLSGFGSGHIFETQNSGSSWTDISGNLPDAPVNGIAVNEQGATPTIYVATDVGVFASSDDGATWQNASAGIPNTVISDVVFDPSSSKLVAATHGRGAFIATVPPARPTNDDFLNGRRLLGNKVDRVGDTNVAATKQFGEPAHAGNAGGKSVWYQWSAPSAEPVSIDTVGSGFDTTLGVYSSGSRGASLPSLTTVASNDDGGGGNGSSAVSFTPISGRNYYIAIDGYRNNVGMVAEGSVNLHLRQPPGNDRFGQATTLSGSTDGRSADSSVLATKETGEPTHAGSAGGSSVWYRWRAPRTGPVTITTLGSSFDTLLGVYTGPNVNALSAVASSDNTGRTLQSKVDFNATTGSVYMVAVDGKAGAAGRVQLALGQRPANDDFAAATTLSGDDVAVTGENSSTATLQPGEPSHGGAVGGASVWYRWQAPDDGPVTIDTGGSSFDTVLAVYTGSGVAALTEVASNDDVMPGLDSSSRVDFVAARGVTYQIAVEDYAGEGGPLELHLLDAAGAGSRCDGRTPTIIGTSSDEVINGTAGADVITAGQGNDTVHGLGGDDTICGGGGDDVADGGGGGDLLDAETVDFSASTTGGAIDLRDGTANVDGSDRLRGTTHVIGSAASDQVFGPAIAAPGVHLEGGPGNDVISDGPANSQIDGGAGSDTVDAGDGNDVISGGDGLDDLGGSAGDDTLSGGGGNDRLAGAGGDDTLAGGAGDDILAGHGSSGADDGADTLDFSSAPGSVTVDLQAGFASGDGSDTISGFSVVRGGGSADSIAGGTAGERLLGAAGDDVIDGGGGNDVLAGDLGNDTLAGATGNDSIGGGSGSDTVSFENAPAAVTVSLAAATAGGEGQDSLDGIEAVEGSRFGDTISGTEAADRLLGGGGSDRIAGLGGSDRIEGGDGGDLLDAGPGLDDILGDAGADTIRARDNQVDLIACGADTDTATADGGDVAAADCETVLVPDTTAPNTVITKGPRRKTKDRTPTFLFNADEVGARFECNSDAGPWQACVSPYTSSRLSYGKHRFGVRATDTAGNVETTPATKTFEVVKRKRRHRH